MTEARLAFIGGSGLYEMSGLSEVEEIDVETPFGAPERPVGCRDTRGDPGSIHPPSRPRAQNPALEHTRQGKHLCLEDSGSGTHSLDQRRR